MSAKSNSVQSAGRLLATVGAIAVAVAVVGEVWFLGLDRIDQSVNRTVVLMLEHHQDLWVLGQAAIGAFVLAGGSCLLLLGWVVIRLGQERSPVASVEGLPLDRAA